MYVCVRVHVYVSVRDLLSVVFSSGGARYFICIYIFEFYMLVYQTLKNDYINAEKNYIKAKNRVIKCISV